MSLHRIPSEILHYIANPDSLQLLTKTARSQVAQNPLKDHFIIRFQRSETILPLLPGQKDDVCPTA